MQVNLRESRRDIPDLIGKEPVWYLPYIIFLYFCIQKNKNNRQNSKNNRQKKAFP